MKKDNGNKGKLAEQLFRKYQIYKVCGAKEELIEDATGKDEWENLTDIDFISRSPGGKPIFHEVKEELHQFTGGYYNITAEALSKEKVMFNGKEYGFRGYREGRNETPLQVAAKALTNFSVRIAWEL